MLRIMLKEKVRGSVSILLIIVMMPMMAVASVIVDASGYELSKAMVSGAADLTMNTALSYYDKVLKDVYGIFGVSATSEELQSNLKEYFVDSLIANGIVDNEEQYNNSQVLKNMGDIFSGNVGQVIDIDASAENSVILTGLDGTELSEPEVLKTQIVEFMKYRTPIYGSMRVLDGLSSLKRVTEQSKVMTAQAEVNEAIGDFNQSCEDAYFAVKDALDYYEQNMGYMIWDKEFGKDDYDKIHKVMVHLGNNSVENQLFVVSHKAQTNQSPEAYIRQFWNLYDCSGWGFQNNISTDSKEVKPENSFSVNRTVSLSETEKSNASASMSEIIERYSLTEGTWDNLESYEDELRNADLFGDAKNIYTVNAFISEYNKMYDDVVYVEEYYDYLCSKGENTEADDNIYKNFMSQICQYSEDARLFAYAMDYIVEMTDVRIKNVYEGLAKKVDVAEKYYKFLETAKNKVDKVADNMVAVVEKNIEFASAILEYEGEDGPDSFSEQMRQEEGYNSQSFSEDNVFYLSLRLEVMKAYVSDYVAELRCINYCEKSIYDKKIDSLTDAAYAYAARPEGGYVISSDYKVNSDIGTIPEDEYKFWRYLKRAFKDAERKDDSKDHENVKDIVSEGNSDTKSALDKDNGIVIGEMIAGEGQATLPSAEFEAEKSSKIDTGKISIGGGSGKVGKYKGFASMMSNMTSVVSSVFSKDGITKALKGARDNLYVTDYAFQMFSYYTFEKEKKEADERKTITGNPINSENNQLYGAEIEYIVFGGDGKSSVDSAMNYIFAIRFMCNTAYAVTSGTIDGLTVPPALAIQTATGGIVPYKLPELIFELALALAETYVDMKDLKNGEDVPLFKNDGTWHMSLKGAINQAAGLTKEFIEKKTKEATEKVVSSFNDVVDSAGSKVTANVDKWVGDYTKALNGAVTEGINKLMSIINTSMLEEIEDVIQKAEEGIDGITSETIINNAWSNVENYLAGLGTDNIVYKIASNSKVKDVLKGYLKEYTTPLDEALGKLKQNTEDAHNAVRTVQELIGGGLAKKATDFITQCSDEITSAVETAKNEYSNKLKAYVGDKAEVAADKIIEITNDSIDACADKLITKLGITDMTIGTGSVKENSLLSFSYADYLSMFLFLKLATSGKAVMCRIADVIQMNMAKISKNTGYRLSDRYTYVELNVNVRYDTIFLSDDWFGNISGETMSGMGIDYHGIRGY